MGDLLAYIITGGLLGLLGQIARVVIGLKGMSDDAKALNLSPNDLFEAGRLITSCLIGFAVGIAAALISLKGVDLTKTLALPGWQTLLGWVAAGYAGTDFLEGFISQYLPQGAAKQKPDDAKNKAADAAANLQLAALVSQHTAPLDGILSGWVGVGAKTPDDEAIRNGIAFCLNSYQKPTQPPPAGAKYWQGQLSAQFKGTDADWIQAACDCLHDEPSPFAADGLTINSVYILRKFNGSTPPSFKIEDFFACVQQCYQHPFGPVS